MEAATVKAKILLSKRPPAFPAKDAALLHHTPAYHLVKDVGRFLCIKP